MVGRDREFDKRLVATLDNLLATIDKDNLLARENRQLTLVSALLLSTAVTSQSGLMYQLVSSGILQHL